MNKKEYEKNKKIQIFSISTTPLMHMGKVRGMGMPSILAFHREMAQLGFDVKYIQVGDGTSALDVECEGFSIKHIKARQLPSWIKRNRYLRKFIELPFWLLSNLSNIQHYIQEQRVQGKCAVLYGHMFAGNLAASIIGKRLSIPNVTRLYGTLLSYRFGLSPQYPVSWIKRYLNLLMYWEETLAILAPTRAYVITNDGTLGDRLVKALRGDKQRIEFMRNGIDIDWDFWLKREVKCEIVQQFFTTNAPVVVTPGRLIAWKRTVRIVEIAKCCKEKQVKVNFLILGNGEKENELRALIKKYELEHMVYIKTDTPHKEMPKYLVCADIVLLVQDYTNLSNTLQEALALEKPVIALDVGGTIEVAQHYKNAFLISLDNWLEEAVEGIQQLINDPDLVKQLKYGAKFWREKEAYSWQERVQTDVALIRELVATECMEKP